MLRPFGIFTLQPKYPKLTMEIETYELTIDDVLALHRSWITDLFLIERKSEVEIVELLYNRQLVVRSVPFLSIHSHMH